MKRRITIRMTPRTASNDPALLRKVADALNNEDIEFKLDEPSETATATTTEDLTQVPIEAEQSGIHTAKATLDLEAQSIDEGTTPTPTPAEAKTRLQKLKQWTVEGVAFTANVLKIVEAIKDYIS